MAKKTLQEATDDLLNEIEKTFFINKVLNWLTNLLTGKKQKAKALKENKARFSAAIMVANEGKIGAEMIADEHLKHAEGPHVEFAQMVKNCIMQIPHGAAIEINEAERTAKVNGEAWA